MPKKKKQNHSLLRTFLWALGFMFIFLVIKRDNLITWAKAAVTVQQQNREIRMNEQQLGQMRQRIDDLTHNPDSLERFARERFNFKRKGDDLYIIRDKK